RGARGRRTLCGPHLAGAPRSRHHGRARRHLRARLRPLPPAGEEDRAVARRARRDRRGRRRRRPPLGRRLRRLGPRRLRRLTARASRTAPEGPGARDRAHRRCAEPSRKALRGGGRAVGNAISGIGPDDSLLSYAIGPDRRAVPIPLRCSLPMLGTMRRLWTTVRPIRFRLYLGLLSAMTASIVALMIPQVL